MHFNGGKYNRCLPGAFLRAWGVHINTKDTRTNQQDSLQQKPVSWIGLFLVSTFCSDFYLSGIICYLNYFLEVLDIFPIMFYLNCFICPREQGELMSMLTYRPALSHLVYITIYFVYQKAYLYEAPSFLVNMDPAFYLLQECFQFFKVMCLDELAAAQTHLWGAQEFFHLPSSAYLIISCHRNDWLTLSFAAACCCFAWSSQP